jgi:hypothetical protein
MKFLRLIGAGPHPFFHTLTLATICTGIFVLLTAGDLGPFSPMLLCIGIYVIFFGLVAELIFGVSTLAGWIADRRRKPASPYGEQESA